RAVNLLTYNEEGWRHVENTWGEGAALVYARIPESEFSGGTPGARQAYYRQNPDALLIKSWLEGRPNPDNQADQVGDYYDNGKDYATAQEMFGEDIWDIVRESRLLPDYVPGDREAGAAWAEFHERYPQFSQWREWWYALMPDLEDNQLNNNQRG